MLSLILNVENVNKIVWNMYNDYLQYTNDEVIAISLYREDVAKQL